MKCCLMLLMKLLLESGCTLMNFTRSLVILSSVYYLTQTAMESRIFLWLNGLARISFTSWLYRGGVRMKYTQISVKEKALRTALATAFGRIDS